MAQKQSHSEKHRIATIKDVARLAGVSVSTVSRVLNNLDRVSEDTRIRVNAAVQKLSYTRNGVAVSMITGRTGVILLVVPDFMGDFYGVVLQGAEKYIREQGYLSIVMSTGDDSNASILEYLNRFVHMIDGAIVVPTVRRLFEPTAYPKPVVVVDRTVESCGMDTVTIDNFDGCYQLTRLLLNENHRRIGLISGMTNVNVGKSRFAGFCAAMQDAGLYPDERYIRRMDVYGELSNQEYGHRYTKDMLALTEPPTALIACNSNICTGCLQAISESGLQLGRDISLVSFDGPMWPEAIGIGVTVAFTPRAEMGAQAAARLIELIASGEKSEPREITLGVKLIHRNSIARL